MGGQADGPAGAGRVVIGILDSKEGLGMCGCFARRRRFGWQRGAGGVRTRTTECGCTEHCCRPRPTGSLDLLAIVKQKKTVDFQRSPNLTKYRAKAAATLAASNFVNVDTSVAPVVDGWLPL